MSGTNFDKIAKNRFKFLELEYKFLLTEKTKKDWGGYELIYQNSCTGVKIVYEFKEAYIFITLFKLVDGELIENPLTFDENSILFGYGLDDVIRLRNPLALIKPAYEYSVDTKYHDKDTGLDSYVSDFADNLKKYANDILIGDFSLFKDLHKIVLERIKKSSY